MKSFKCISRDEGVIGVYDVETPVQAAEALAADTGVALSDIVWTTQEDEWGSGDCHWLIVEAEELRRQLEAMDEQLMFE